MISSAIKHASDMILECHIVIKPNKQNTRNVFKIKWTEMHKFMILLLQMKTHFSNGNVKSACNCFALKAKTTIISKSVITILHLGKHNIESQ